MTIINVQSEAAKGLHLAEAETTARGKLAVFFREHCLAGNYLVMLETFKVSLDKHGQRSKSNGNVSTPTDSIRATINNVTKALVGNEGYKFQGALGIKTIEGEITLYDKGDRVQRSKSNKFDKLAKGYKTDAQKRKALADFAKALGLEA